MQRQKVLDLNPVAQNLDQNFLFQYFGCRDFARQSGHQHQVLHSPDFEQLFMLQNFLFSFSPNLLQIECFIMEVLLKGKAQYS